MKILLADIETRSRIDLKKVGQRRYALDPSTQITTAVWKWKGQPQKYSACPIFPHIASQRIDHFIASIAEADQVVFHNANFDVAVIEATQKVEIPLSKIVCTMAMAQRMSYPGGLDELCRALNIPGKLDGGRALVMATCKPRADGSFLGDAGTEEEQRIFRSLLMYNMGDVEPLERIIDTLPPLPTFERVIWERTWRKNKIGLPIDLQLAQAVASRRAAIEDEVSLELKRLTATPDCPGGMVDKVTQRDRILRWFAFMEYPLENTRKDTIDETLDQVGDNVPAQIVRVLQILKESGGTAPTKAATLLERHVNGWYKDATRYFGARSGRGTSEGVNTFNIARPSQRYDVETVVRELRDGRGQHYDNTALSDSLRGLICAPDKWRIIDCDEMQGELRIQLWLCGDTERLNMLVGGDDLYAADGRQIFGIPGLTKKTHPIERQVAKTGRLGFGYGCGGPRFTTTIWADTNLPMDIRRDFTEERGGLIIQQLRRNNPLLCAYGTGLWSQFDSAARSAISRPGVIYEAARGLVAFCLQGSTLWLRLPSGRTLPHYNAAIDQFGEFWFYRAKNGRMMRQKVYGGAWLEIICQSILRDVVIGVEAQIEREIPDAYLLLDIYDSVVLLAREERAEDVTKHIVEIMQRPIPWAPGLPVSGEGYYHQRMKK